MNREIEFRGLDSFGKWWYGNLVVERYYETDIKDLSITKEKLIYKIRSDGFDVWGYNNFEHKVISNTVSQYADIKDAKGNKIYEGDVLEHTFTDITTNKILSTKFLVRFNNGMFGTWYKDVTGEWIEEDRLSNYLIELDKLEVVGNIFDNPELISDVEWR